MTALASNGAPPPYGEGQPTLLSLPAAAATLIFAGAIVCKNTSGYGVNGTAATGLIACGVARFACDNSAGAAGDKNVEIESGVFGFAIGTAGDALTQADVLNTVYLIDNQTVGKTDGTGTRSAAGKLVRLEGGLAFVYLSGGL